METTPEEMAAARKFHEALRRLPEPAGTSSTFRPSHVGDLVARRCAPSRSGRSDQEPVRGGGADCAGPAASRQAHTGALANGLQDEIGQVLTLMASTPVAATGVAMRQAKGDLSRVNQLTRSEVAPAKARLR